MVIATDFRELTEEEVPKSCKQEAPLASHTEVRSHRCANKTNRHAILWDCKTQGRRWDMLQENLEDNSHDFMLVNQQGYVWNAAERNEMF